MNEVITQESSDQAVARVSPSAAPVPYNPFAKMQAAHINAGTVEIESQRAVADAQVKMLMAQRFPRDEAASFAKAMAACQRPILANKAFYSYPRGGETISGPTIRLAEALANAWGRIHYGIRELSRNGDTSEMEAFAIDLENIVYVNRAFTVRHVRDTRGGKKELTEERDIYELTANLGGRRLRACIMAVLPADLKEAAINECRKTISSGGGTAPIADRIKRMVMTFAGIGVSDALLAKRLGHKLDTTTPDELADLHGIFTSIKDNVSKIDDWFGDKPAGGADDGGEAPAQKSGINGVVQEAAKAAAEEQATTAAGAAKEPAHAKEKPARAPARTAAKDGKDSKKNSNPPQESAPAPEVQEPQAPAPTSQPDDDGPVF